MFVLSGQDLRYALRQLRNSPGFTAVAVIILALGIGANTAIFSVVEGVALAPLPYFQPDRLVMIWENNPRFPRVWNSYPNFKDWQRSAQSFEQIVAFRGQEVDLSFPGAASHLKASQISSGFFHCLGTELALGREFTAQEDQPGGARAAVISDHLWRERFGRSPEALGRGVTLDGVSYSVVGVAPPRFRVIVDADVYTPLGQLDPLIRNNRGTHDGIFALARLKPGIAISESQVEMSTVQSRLDHLYPNENRDLGIYVEPLKQAIVGNAGQRLALLVGAVGLLLMITCANLANLMLARSAGRTREFAIRSALGASRARLARQLLTESVILSFGGGCVGTLIAFLGIRPMLAVIPGSLPRSEQVGVNAPVLLYTLLISLFAGIAFGLVPALKNWNANQNPLQEGGRGSTVVHRRTESSFIVLQVALTVVLLVGTGLLLRTILHLSNVDPGFDTANVVTLKVGVSYLLTQTPSSTRVAYQQLIERIRQIPGVQAADFTTAIPLSGQGGYLPFWLDSQRPESLQGAPRLEPFLTGPGYLRTMGMHLLQGRFLSENDTDKTPCVAVIDRNFAKSFFPDGKPLGHTVTAGFAAFGPCEIVGVVNHVKDASLNDAGLANQYQTYYSLYQVPDRWVPINYPEASIVVRTTLDSATIVHTIKSAIYQSGGDQPVYAVHSMRQIISDSISEQRFPMILLSTFAGLALLLAAVGIYGVISHSVTQRVQEIGIRMALGADKGRVVRLFVGKQLTLVSSAVVLGGVGALVLTRVLSSFSHLLYGVGAADPVTCFSASILLITVAALAAYIPARRATKVDPMVALRRE